MNNKKNGIPKLRFPGFTGAWEQRKWVDSINISNEMVDPTTGKFDDMPHIAPGNIESFTGRILDNVKTVKEEELISGKFLFKPGDVVFGKINPQLGKYFYARVEGLTSADSYVLNGKNKNITQMFIFLLLQTRDFFKYSVSVSKRSGIPKINREELNGFKFLIPCKEEQEKIGDFFLNIDSLIALHQRKLEHLQEQKKGLLQKMFPKNGETVPEVRFPGFTDAWEQRKLGEITSVITKGTTPLDKSGKGSINFVKVEDLSPDNSGINVHSMISKEEHEGRLKRSILKENDILFSIAGTLGRIGIVKSEILPANTNQALAIVRLKEGNLSYISTVLEGRTVREYIRQNPTVGAQPNLSLKQVSELRISFPTLQEQEQVGNFFNKLNSFIALHQRKLDHLELMKKGLLQQMFV